MLSRRQFLAAAASALAAAPRQPNLIIILTDDQGYGDVGVYGANGFETPNLDRMAREGVRFTSFYAAPVCTPSRAALMTGCYPVRVSLGYRVLFPYSITGLHPDEITLAESLAGRGYRTACIGKWHLGHHAKFLPTRQGFHSYFGTPYSNDMGNHNYAQIPFQAPPLPLMSGEEVVEKDPDQRYLTRRYTEEAVQFIGENKARPFFLYVAHNMPHAPIAASEAFQGRSALGLYGDVIEELDWSVGEVLSAVRKAGIEKDTLVIFTSDNGPAGSAFTATGEGRGSAEPLRGRKGSTWEGGLRVPCIMRWPGRIPAGLVCDEMATNMDIFPTAVKLAGGSVPADRRIDGKDIWPLMSGRAGAKSPHRAFFYYQNETLEAVRSDNWKLHVHKPEWEADPATRPPGPLLYDLNEDVGETRNLKDARCWRKPGRTWATHRGAGSDAMSARLAGCEPTPRVR